MEARLKAKYKYHHGLAAVPHDDKKASKMQLLSREARSNQRRLLTAFGELQQSCRSYSLSFCAHRTKYDQYCRFFAYPTVNVYIFSVSTDKCYSIRRKLPLLDKCLHLLACLEDEPSSS